MDTIPGEAAMPTPPHPPLAGLDPAALLKQGVAGDTLLEDSPPFHLPPIVDLAVFFPQFEILELIGQGGMGAVYKVRQKELDRIVALKILPPAIGETPGFSERFAREAKALARLNHPGIVTIHEFGKTSNAEQPLYFILMEFVDGVNLAQLMKAGRMAPREALAIVPQICDALQFAHDQGIVHRDIKPENILLDRLGRVKVADFGIAKVIAPQGMPEADENPQGGALGSDATIAGKVIGTPQYMAPEQIDSPAEVDHRADIYALGVVFYQMLTGELPGKNLQAPSRKVGIDVRLDEMVLRALDHNPERRYQTAQEFRTVVDGMHAIAPPPLLPRRGMFRRWWWVFLVMLVIGPVLGLGGGAIFAHFVTKKYESEVVVELKPRDGQPMNSSRFGTEFEKIKSTASLTEVAKQLDLSKKWGVRGELQAVSILKGIVQTENIRGTDLITIRVRHTDNEGAANIARAVALTYKRNSNDELVIHEEPTVPKSPVSPNIPLLLVMGGAGGLLLSPLLALLVMVLLQLIFSENRSGRRMFPPVDSGRGAYYVLTGLAVVGAYGLSALPRIFWIVWILGFCGMAAWAIWYLILIPYRAGLDEGRSAVAKGDPVRPKKPWGQFFVLLMVVAFIILVLIAAVFTPTLLRNLESATKQGSSNLQASGSPAKDEVQGGPRKSESPAERTADGMTLVAGRDGAGEAENEVSDPAVRGGERAAPASVQERMVDLEIRAMTLRKMFLPDHPDVKKAALAVDDFIRANPTARGGDYVEMLVRRREAVRNRIKDASVKYLDNHPQMAALKNEMEAIEQLIRIAWHVVSRPPRPSATEEVKYRFDCGGDSMQMMVQRIGREHWMGICFESCAKKEDEGEGIAYSDLRAELEMKEIAGRMTLREKERLVELRRYQMPDTTITTETRYYGEIIASSDQDLLEQLTQDTPYQCRPCVDGKRWVVSPREGSRLDYPVTLDTAGLTVEQAAARIAAQSPAGKVELIGRSPEETRPWCDAICAPRKFEGRAAWEVLCEIGAQEDADSMYDLVSVLVIQPGRKWTDGEVPARVSEDRSVSVSNQYLDLVSDMAAAKVSGLGEAHPDRVTLRKRLDRLKVRYPHLPDDRCRELASQRLPDLEDEKMALMDRGLGEKHPDLIRVQGRVDALKEIAGAKETVAKIHLSANGGIMLNGVAVSQNELPNALKLLRERSKDVKVSISGDPNLPYERVMEVIDLCQKSGIWNLTFVDDEKKHLDGVAEWLGKMDLEKYAECYSSSTDAVKKVVSEEKWKEAMVMFRTPMGTVISRRMIKSEEVRQLPGLPDGEHRVTQFETEFANKKSAVETVIFTKENDGVWKSSGYFIR